MVSCRVTFRTLDVRDLRESGVLVSLRCGLCMSTPRAADMEPQEPMLFRPPFVSSMLGVLGSFCLRRCLGQRQKLGMSPILLTPQG